MRSRGILAHTLVAFLAASMAERYIFTFKEIA